NPPAMTPTTDRPSTVLLPSALVVAVTLLMVPAFDPASVPRNWVVPPKLGFALTLKSIKLRLRTAPPVPIEANRPILLSASESVGAMMAFLMEWPWPSSVPVNGDQVAPIGDILSALMSRPSAYVPLTLLLMFCRSEKLLTSMYAVSLPLPPTDTLFVNDRGAE